MQACTSICYADSWNHCPWYYHPDKGPEIGGWSTVLGNGSVYCVLWSICFSFQLGSWSGNINQYHLGQEGLIASLEMVGDVPLGLNNCNIYSYCVQGDVKCFQLRRPRCKALFHQLYIYIYSYCMEFDLCMKPSAHILWVAIEDWKTSNTRDSILRPHYSV